MMDGVCFTATSILKTNLISKLGIFCNSLNIEYTLSNCREFPQFIAVIFSDRKQQIKWRKCASNASICSVNLSKMCTLLQFYSILVTCEGSVFIKHHTALRICGNRYSICEDG